MDATRQIFQVSKLPDTLSFFIIPGMFQWNLTEIGQIYTPDKFAQSICIPPKIKREILAYKRLQTTRLCQETISLPETANQWDNGTSWLHWQWIKIFWEKVNHERHIFWSRSLSGALIFNPQPPPPPPPLLWINISGVEMAEWWSKISLIITPGWLLPFHLALLIPWLQHSHVRKVLLTYGKQTHVTPKPRVAEEADYSQFRVALNFPFVF